MLTVKNYSAAGDGVTDDTSAILNAQSNGCQFYPEGTYLVTDAACIKGMIGSDGPGVLYYCGSYYPAARLLRQVTLCLMVPAVFPTIQSALDWAAQKQIYTDAWLKIAVSDGTYSIRNIKSAVKDWSRLIIVGNESDYSKCTLQVDCTNNGNGFLFNMGNGCGWLNGFYILGNGAFVSDGVWNDQCYGAGIISEGSGSHVTCGPGVVTENMYYGYRAMFGGSMYADYTIARHSGDCGYHSYGGSIRANYAKSSYASHLTSDLGHGFCVESSGMMECEYAESYGNHNSGFVSIGNSSMWAHTCKSHDNRNGFWSLNGGYLEANGLGTTSDKVSNAYNNTYGYRCSNGGVMQVANTWANNVTKNYFIENGGIQVS